MMESSFHGGSHHGRHYVVKSGTNLSIGVGFLHRGHIIDLATLRT